MATRPDDPTIEVLTAVTNAATVPLPTERDRFAPGAIVAGRYRLVSLLGRGGMGEVYRADDLTLDQPVALKFLPHAVGEDADRLKRFHNELRVARQVSHRNVCRLYDLGEAGGRPFLTMEYVDGEDLASLLRRIGRVPQDRAVQMARQLCAGVAAAHDCGVLHRDLKPANVMIDGDGNVRITDFGIATAVGEQAVDFSGTPQYMAPEQLDGQGASIKTDIFSLGLILFELFTGRRVVDGKTLGDVKRFHASGETPTVTTIVPDLDPAIERVVHRCLDRDPNRRPASALAIASALPGGDPLAAALAAGETPSPEVLAAAAETDALPAAKAVAALVAVVIGLIAMAFASSRVSIVSRTPLEKAPAVLADRAVQLIAELGYQTRIGDHAFDFERDDEYLDWIQQNTKTPNRWDVVTGNNPSAVLFWYRTSPQTLVPFHAVRITLDDPPLVETDMRTVVLDASGRLRQFRSVPPQVEPQTDAVSAPPWETLFAAAGLPMGAFSPVSPQWTPPDYADSRMAWQGTLPGRADVPLRVEGAAYRGRPVYFAVIGPWNRPTRMEPRGESRMDAILEAVAVVVITIIFLVAFAMARRNLRANRADRRGAARVLAFMIGAALIEWIVTAHHQLALGDELDSLVSFCGPYAIVFAVLWVMYLALEPYVRRFWPDSLLGWSRLLAGHVKDPRVGRDVLVGCCGGLVLAFVELGKVSLLPMLGYPAPRPWFGLVTLMLSGLGPVVFLWIAWALAALEGALITVLIIVILRLALRRISLALIVTSVIVSVAFMQYMMDTGWLGLLFPLTNGVVFTLIAFRFGLLPLVVSRFVYAVVVRVPIVLGVSDWAAAPGLWTMAALLALTVCAFVASRAGQPLFGSWLDERAPARAS